MQGNPFGVLFEKSARNIGASFEHKGFDSSVIQVCPLCLLCIYNASNTCSGSCEYDLLNGELLSLAHKSDALVICLNPPCSCCLVM